MLGAKKKMRTFKTQILVMKITVFFWMGALKTST